MYLGEEGSGGALHSDGSPSVPKGKDHPVGGLFLLEQGTGVEPASEAWEATIIADIRTLRMGAL